jgi:hypothetical protein
MQYFTYLKQKKNDIYEAKTNNFRFEFTVILRVYASFVNDAQYHTSDVTATRINQLHYVTLTTRVNRNF